MIRCIIQFRGSRPFMRAAALLLGILAVNDGLSGPRPAWGQKKKTPEEIKKQNEFLILQNRAEGARKKGNLEVALADGTRVLKIAEDLYGPKSYQSTTARGFLANIGKAYESQEKFDAAATVYEGILEDATRVFGEKSDKEIDARLDLAHCRQVAKLDREQRQRLKEAEVHSQTASTLSQAGKNQQALALALKTLAIRREILGEEHRLTAGVLNQIGRYHTRLDQFEEAEKSYKQAIAINRRVLGEEHHNYTADLHNLAVVYDAQHKFDPAEELYREVLAKRTVRENPAVQAICLKNMAMLYIGKQDFMAAEKLAKQAVEIHERIDPSGSNQAINAMMVLSSVHAAKGNPAEALKVTEKARAICKNNGSSYSNYSHLLNQLGVYYKETGEYIKADEMYREALKTEASRGGETAHYAVILANQGKLYVAMGDRRRAELNLIEAAALHKKNRKERHPDQAYIYNSLGFVRQHGGDYAAAEPLFKQALEIQQAVLGTNHSECARTLLSLGQLYLNMGDPDRAEPFHVKALQMMEKTLGPDHLLTAEALDCYAALCRLTGRYAAAEKMQLRATETTKKVVGESHPTYILQLGALGLLYQQTGDLERARSVYQQALELAKKRAGEKDPRSISVIHNLGSIYLQTGDYAKAEEMLSRSAKLDSWKNEIVTQKNLAWLYQATGRKQQALELQLKCLENEQQTLRSIFGFTAEASMHASVHSMNHTFERLLSMAGSNGPTDAEGTVAALTWTLRRKGIILDTLCRFRTAQHTLAGDPKLGDLASRWRFLRQRMADVALNPEGMDRLTYTKRMAEWTAEAERMEAELNRVVADRVKDLGDVNVEGVRVQLTPGSALVELVRARRFDFKATDKLRPWSPDHYFAFVLRADESSPVALIDLGLAAPIDDGIARLRAQIQKVPREIRTSSENDLEAEFAKVSSELYRQIFAPVEKHLGKETMLFIAPDGELNRLPFEALVDDKGKYLVERYRMVYLASGRDLLRPAVDPARGTVVFAGPDYDLKSKDRRVQAEKLKLKAPTDTVAVRGGAAPELRGMRWKPLRGAAAEANDVAEALADGEYGPVRAYRGTEALEEALKAMKAPRILHLATHGFFLPDDPKKEDTSEVADSGAAAGVARLRRVSNPLLRSGIVLAGANALGEEGAAGEDGWVTAEEISLLNLRGTELVVLSACESGLGDVRAGEGVFGLRRAFLYAGARTLLNSLFEVPDTQTREMMRIFYARIKAGKGKVDALHDAQLDMIRRRRQEHQAAHPFFWASFVLVGDPK